MEPKEILNQIYKGQTLAEVSDIVHLVTVSISGDGVTQEMLDNAKISQELWQKMLDDAASKYSLPGIICHLDPETNMLVPGFPDPRKIKNNGKN